MAATLATRFCISLTTKSYDPIDIAALKAAGDLSTRWTSPWRNSAAAPKRWPARHASCSPAVSAAGSARQEPRRSLTTPATSTRTSPRPTRRTGLSTTCAATRVRRICLAGFIWAALGDTAIATRWQAAHAVCVLVSLHKSAVLEALARYASGELPAGPFADQRLHFYDKHALVWLLPALERSAAAPDRSGLRPFIPLLLATAAAD